MPRPVQTLSFAEALVRIFRSQGKAKLWSDDTIVPVVGCDITKPPFNADGAHYFETSRTLAANAGFPSQVALLNGDGVIGEGVCVVDRVNVAAPAVAGDQVYVGFANDTAAASYTTTCFDVGRPFVDTRPTAPVLQRVPVGRFSSNAIAAVATNTGRYTIPADGLVLNGPWVLPGIVPQEELWMATVAVNKPLGVTVRGRWYPGIKPSAP